MSKERPYFKFTCDSWLTGDITLEDFSLQGLFASACAYYWKKDCKMSMAKLKRRYSSATDEMWKTLLDEDIIKECTSGVISISFLDRQWNEMDNAHKEKSDAGKKGAEKRWGSHS